MAIWKKISLQLYCKAGILRKGLSHFWLLLGNKWNNVFTNMIAKSIKLIQPCLYQTSFAFPCTLEKLPFVTNYLCKFECIGIPTEVFICKQVYTNMYVYKKCFPSLFTLFPLFFFICKNEMRVRSVRQQ